MSNCYAGTHDNETTVGWWKDSAQPQEKEYIKRYLNTSGKDISGDFMREAFKSVSRTAIVMLQVCMDVAGMHGCCMYAWTLHVCVDVAGFMPWLTLRD